MRIAVLATLALMASGCASEPRGVAPIGTGPLHRPSPGARPVAGLACGDAQPRDWAHLELFAHGKVMVVPAGIGVAPPFERGVTCSNVRSCDANRAPQYWQRKRSRRKTLNRVNGARREAVRYARSATTDGIRTCVDGLRTILSYWATTLTLPLKTARIASSHDSVESGKYETGLKSAFKTSAG